MGRCNNRRARQAAESQRNTPARARFSSGPPRKKKPSRKRDAKVAVVQKMERRVTTTRAAPQPTRKVFDLEKLDAITISKDCIDRIETLLKDLNVMEEEHILTLADQQEEANEPEQNDSEAIHEHDNENEDEQSVASSKDEPQVSQEETIILHHLTKHFSFDHQTVRVAYQSVPIKKLVDVMDWLCLHLDEKTLETSFQIQENSQPLIKIKAIPHPSISVAKSLEVEHREWLKQLWLEEQMLPYLKFGFRHAEILSCLEGTVNHGENNTENETKVWRRLLANLEPTTSTDTGNSTEVDDDEEEIVMEQEALAAIYENDFTFDAPNRRYSIAVKIALNDGSESSGILHVLLRAGYPSGRLPLFLFESVDFPWPFLRIVHQNLLKGECQGVPVVFETVNLLTDSLPEWWEQFQEKEAPSNEKDGAVVERATEEDEDERRKKLQEERLERIKNENIRQSMADQEIQKRELERRDTELRTVSRAAMSRAFNSGASVEEAREAARQAEKKYTKEHGMDDGGTDSNVDSDDDEPDETPGDMGLSNATPMTLAFMDRLRSMYAKAARGNYELDDPVEEASAEGDILPCPVSVPIGEVARLMEEHVVAVQKDQPWLVAPEARVPRTNASDETSSFKITTERQEAICEKLQEELHQSIDNPSKKVRQVRLQNAQLPAFKMKEDIISACRENQVTLISASTGAGKTTIVPGLLLNDMISRGIGCYANIWVTQPRRISAISVAERIASERGERVGDSCGYSIKLEKKCSRKTRITLCTTGVLLRRLQCDPDLANVSHVIVDEVHERDINSDFLLIILKDLLRRRKNLKLILMSATFDAGLFASYFDSCAVVEIPGRAFPVKEFRLEDVLEVTGYEVQEDSDYAFKRPEKVPGKLSKSALKKLYHPKYSPQTIHSLSIVDESMINYELLSNLLEHIAVNGEEGAILVFCPGLAEIAKAIDEMRRKEIFQSEKVVIYPLHSSLSTSEQQNVFEIPPSGVRKIVVATNIAETSITVTDILYVVDTGRVKENRRDEVKETPALVECWVSKASAQQRKGRAGRVRPGFAYQLFSTHTHNSEMDQYQLPEISRVGIEELILQILTLDLGEPPIFLAKALTPPSNTSMKSSLKLLEELGAVECDWQPEADNQESCAALCDTSTELTALGFHLASLPVAPRIGKLLMYGALFSCVEPALTIAAALSSKSPFNSPFDNRDAANEARKTFSVDNSDHLTILEAFNQWKQVQSSKGNRATTNFLRRSFLSRQTLIQMEELRKQFAELLTEIGFLPSDLSSGSWDANVNATNMDLLKAVLCAGLYPNIIRGPHSLEDGSSRQTANEFPFQSRNKGEIYLHPSTLASKCTQLPTRFCCYHDILQTSKLYVRDVTSVSPFALLLFGGALRVYHKDGVMEVDNWLCFRAGTRPAILIKHLRSQMETLLLKKIVDPDSEVTSTPEANAMVESVCTLLGQHTISDAADIVRPWHGSDEPTGGRGGRDGRGGRGRGRNNGRRR